MAKRKKTSLDKLIKGTGMGKAPSWKIPKKPIISVYKSKIA